MTLAFINGRFDVFHYGHLLLLEKAAQVADQVYVALDSDERIKQLTGTDPVVPANERAAIVAAIRFCTKTFIFNSDQELENLVKLFTPYYMVKGEDYAYGKHIIGAEHCKKIIYVPRFNSSTEIKKRISSR